MIRIKTIKEIIEDAKCIVEITKELWQEEEFRKSIRFPLFSLAVSAIILIFQILVFFKIR